MKVHPVHPQCFLLLSNISDFAIWVGRQGGDFALTIILKSILPHINLKQGFFKSILVGMVFVFIQHIEVKNLSQKINCE